MLYRLKTINRLNKNLHQRMFTWIQGVIKSPNEILFPYSLSDKIPRHSKGTHCQCSSSILFIHYLFLGICLSPSHFSSDSWLTGWKCPYPNSIFEWQTWYQMTNVIETKILPTTVYLLAPIIHILHMWKTHSLPPKSQKVSFPLQHQLKIQRPHLNLITSNLPNLII